MTSLDELGRPDAVLLDVRRSAHDAASIEAAVSAAASVVTANSARRDLVRLVTTDGTDTGFGVGGTHLDAVLEHLAGIDLSGSASLRSMIDLLRRTGGGALVVVLGRATPEDTAAANRGIERAAAITRQFGGKRRRRHDAACEDGILTVELPLSRPARPRTVPIRGTDR